MIHNDQLPNGRQRMTWLVPLMLAANLFLLSCVLGLGVMTIRGLARGAAAPSYDDSRQAVADYLAEHVAGHRFRVRQWYPAEPLEGAAAALAADRSAAALPQGFVQRVQIEFYGPSGTRQLDTVYWVQNGQVTRIMPADPGPVARSL
jgi:hypothetical protein